MSQPSIAWARSFFAAANIEDIETVCATAYSHVMRLRTAVGVFYLKTTPPALFREAAVLARLQQILPGTVPELVAQQPQFNCFLMRDAGVPLRTFLKGGGDVALFAGALEQYAQLQQRAADEIPALLALDVPDWRCERLPDLFLKLLNCPEVVESSLSVAERAALLRHSDAVAQCCKKLAAGAIPDTIEHADFHDSNILMADGKFCVIDWGEAVISHPFFSLVNCLFSAAHHHGYVEGSTPRLKAKSAYLQRWHYLADAQHVADMYEQVEYLAVTYKVLVYKQLADSCGEPGQQIWARRIIPALQTLASGVEVA